LHVVFQLWQWRFRLAKQKPHRRLAVGFDKSVMQSEPDRHAAQQQRVQQQVQIQIAIHEGRITARSQRVKSFFFRLNRCLWRFQAAFAFRLELNG